MYLCRRLFLTSGASGPGNTLGGFLLLASLGGQADPLTNDPGPCSATKDCTVSADCWLVLCSVTVLLTHNLEAFLVVISLPPFLNSDVLTEN